MKTENIVLEILVDLTGTDEIRENKELNLFEEGLLDSLGTVQLLVELEDQCAVTVPVSDFERDEWATPQMIIEKVVAMQS